MSHSPAYGFHPKCASLGITHLAYGDDLLLLARGDVNSIYMIMNCLNDFGDMAGLRINIFKSNIYMTSIDDNVRRDILDLTGFIPGELPFRYLGIPLAARQLRSSDYHLLVVAIVTKVNSWPRNSLSYAGKLELIRSMIQGVECFWLSILPIPTCIIDKIQSICRKFVWPMKHPPIAWDTLCKPKEDGGLGLKNLKAWNNVLIVKTLWKIHMKKDSLWIRWVNHFYSNSADVWDWNWHKQQSPLIKQLLAIRDNFVRGLGSVDAAATCLDQWFCGNEGLSEAYDYFVHKRRRWPWQALIRKSCILPKQWFILWLLAYGKLLTRDRQLYVSDKLCVLCKSEDESILHLYFSYNICNKIWGAIRDWLGMRKLMGTPSAMLRAFRQCYGGTSTLNKMRCTALAETVYQIWNLRNRALFEDEKPVVEDSIRKIKIQIFRCFPSHNYVFRILS